MAFNLEDYEQVEVRLDRWWKENSDGRIATELISFANGQYIVQAYLYRTFLDSVAYATGLAEEKISDRGVNSTSALENCETSAIGRALANANYAAKGKRPSREEMSKVVQHPVQPAKPVEVIPNDDKAPWEIYGDSKVPEPALAMSIKAIEKVLGGKVIEQPPLCQHGAMQRKVGNNVRGEPYAGWVCSETRRAEQCPAQWDEKK